MNVYTTSDGKTISAGVAFTSNGIQYPANWIELATDQDLTDHQITKSVVPDPVTPLDEVKTALKIRVDEDAERVRLRYITPGSGMALTYQEKFAQATAVHAMGQSPANALTEAEYKSMFPTLAASIGIEAPTLWDCATLVLQRFAQFATLSNAIERIRLSGKKAISDASDAACADAAYEAISWAI